MGSDTNIEKQFLREAHRSVADFLSPSQNKDPMLYPGERPKGSYITDGSLVYTLEVQDTDHLAFTMKTADGEEMDVNMFLKEKGALFLEDRIPVLCFGANMSPSSLASKFTKVGREDAYVIPTAYTTLRDHDVVWSGGPGMNGNFIAVLYNGEEVKGTEVQVGVNFLTREQLLVMNATEMAYQLAHVDVSIGGHPVRAYYYVGQDQIYTKDGLPVAIDSVPATGRIIDESNTRQLLEDVIQDEGIVEKVAESFPGIDDVETVEDYLSMVAALKIEKRSLKLKKAMHEAINGRGMARRVEPAGVVDHTESWANPSTLPTLGDQQLGLFHHPVYRLPTEELGRWENTDARNKLLRSITGYLIRHSEGNLKEVNN